VNAPATLYRGRSGSLSEIPEWYDRVYSASGFRATSEFYHEVASNCRGNVLDVACGYGLIFQHIDGVGCDISTVALKKAAQGNPRSSFVRSNAHQLPFRSGVFDTVTCMGSLEHFHRQDAALREFSRVLRPAGICLLTVTNAHRFTRWGRFLSNEESQPIMHPLNPTTVISLITNAGFELVSVEKPFQFDAYGPLRGGMTQILRFLQKILPKALSIEPMYILTKRAR